MASHRRPSQSGPRPRAPARHRPVGRGRDGRGALASRPGGRRPARRPPTAARSKVDRLYQEAEQATEQYNKADEQADRLRDAGGPGAGQRRPGPGARSTGCGARSVRSPGAQYRSGGIDPALALLLSSDPDSYLDKASALDRLERTPDRRAAGPPARPAAAGPGACRGRAASWPSWNAAAAEPSPGTSGPSRRSSPRRAGCWTRCPPPTATAYDRASRSGRGEPPTLSGGAPSSERAAAAVQAARARSAGRTCGAPTGPRASTARG